MKHARAERRFVLVALLLVLACGARPGSLDAQWSSTSFLVVDKDPYDGNPPSSCTALPPAHTFDPFLSASNPLAGQLGEIARIFSAAGLREPVLSPMVSGVRRVFSFPFPGDSGLEGSLAEFAQACELTQKNPNHCDRPFGNNWLAFDSDSKSFAGYSSLEQKRYLNAAHELFHPVQSRYEFLNETKGGETLERCEIGDLKWIVEGTPDAVGSFLLERKIHRAGGTMPEAREFVGLRPYDASLNDASNWSKRYVRERVPDGDTDFIGYYTSSFWRFLMDRYASGLDDYDPQRLQAITEKFLSREPPAKLGTIGDSKQWLDWVAGNAGKHWGPFHHVYAEFVTELASWPVGKYPSQDEDDWLDLAFGGCKEWTLSLSDEDKGVSKTFKLRGPTSEMEEVTGKKRTPFHAVAARCFQIELSGLQGKWVKLRVKVTAKTVDEADQLHLGIAREETGDPTRDYDCYSHASGAAPKKFRCLPYGKTHDLIEPEGKRSVRTWRHRPRKIRNASETTTFVLANVDTKEPSSTKELSWIDVTFALDVSDGRTDKGASLGLPESFRIDVVPDLGIETRQQVYGITKRSEVETGYAMNLAPLQVAALNGDDVAESYVIVPTEPVALGQTGPIAAMVMVGRDASGTGTISNLYCSGSQQNSGVRVLRSDRETLRVAIDTPLCELSLSSFDQCKNGCPRVDRFQGELALAFGSHYFAQSEFEDLVTPAVERDIDRYHHEVFGEPLPGSSGGDGGGSGGSASGSGGEGGGDGEPGSGGAPRPCDCSCEAFREIERKRDEMQESGIPDFDFMQELARCAFSCAEAFRDCRRSEG